MKQRVRTVEITEVGFVVNLDGETTHFVWEEIERLSAFKYDRLTTDEICLNIQSENVDAIATEEFIGWRELVNAIHERFPEIDKNWEGFIAQPPFATNHMVLYDAKN